MQPPPPKAREKTKPPPFKEATPVVRSPKKFDVPVPLSEFAKRGKSQSTQHTGHGRRDSLSAGERTRILRMLRDEGARVADEDSQVYIGVAPATKNYDFDFDDEGAAPIPPPAAASPQLRDEVPAKPAVVVGLAAAAAARRAKRTAASMPSQSDMAPDDPAPEVFSRKRPTAPPPVASAPPAAPRTKRTVPPPFGDEPTRQVNEAMLASLRAPGPAAAQKPTGMPKPGPFDDQPTRLADINVAALSAIDEGSDGFDAETRAEHPFLMESPSTDSGLASLGRAIPTPIHGVPQQPPAHLPPEDATRLANLDKIAAAERKRSERGEVRGERGQRNDKSISDVDWDLD
jgi:hypothetical protein